MGKSIKEKRLIFLKSGGGRLPTTHLTCPNCKGEFDYVMSVESYLVHAPGNVEIITSTGERYRTTSIKLWNKHRIECPYCKTKSWFKVNI